MAMTVHAIKGTQDVLPSQSGRWQYVERRLMETARLYGFRELRTPVFEHTELFDRSVGDTTDVVQKEMYTFSDNGGRSVSLRPEGTAGAVRAFLEHGLHNEALPAKICYALACYRYEKPQAGRLREFHQFGVECFGAPSPAADAEVIALASSAFDALGVKGLRLELNSIGCPACRPLYTQALKDYFAGHAEELCDTCRDRLARNPMRILDCKSPVCAAVAAKAPLVTDFLCEDCRAHQRGVEAHLNARGVAFVNNPRIVRGLDYYTRTVFEFISSDLGAQATVCGGGRYDGLVEQMGGPSVPALGFGMGLERLLMVMEAQGCDFPEDKPCLVYLAPMGEAASLEATRLCGLLRDEGFSAETDLAGRGLKAQMKYANKLGARYTVVLGEEELAARTARLKNMSTGEEKPVALPDGLLSALYDSEIESALNDLNATLESDWPRKEEM